MAKGLFEGTSQKLVEALATFIAMENATNFVTMSELGQFLEVHEVVLPKSSEEFKDATIIEGEEVLTLSPGEQEERRNF